MMDLPSLKESSQPNCRCRDASLSAVKYGQTGHGRLDQLDGDVPRVEPVQRLHLLPCGFRLRGDLRLEAGEPFRHCAVEGDQDDSQNQSRHYAEDAQALRLGVRAVRGHRADERSRRPDETDGHQAPVARLLRACGTGLALQSPDLGHERAVRAGVNAGALRQLPELRARQHGERPAEFVTVARQRLIDVRDQKKVPLAWALTSDDAENGMRVV